VYFITFINLVVRMSQAPYSRLRFERSFGSIDRFTCEVRIKVFAFGGRTNLAKRVRTVFGFLAVLGIKSYLIASDDVK